MGAQVRAADPHVVEATAVDGLVTRVEPTPDELADADAVVLLTDHDAFDFAGHPRARPATSSTAGAAWPAPNVETL